MSTEAQKRASTNYNRKQDNIMVRPNKEEGSAIRAAAAAAGQSVQGYVLEAIREKMERERAGGVPAGSPAAEDRPGVVSPVPERFPYIPDGEDTPRAAVAISPTQDKESSPTEQPERLSLDDWAVWAQRHGDESLESWKQRLDRSYRGLSMSDVAKRLSKLSEHERNMLM